jgi:hypothetical protein
VKLLYGGPRPDPDSHLRRLFSHRTDHKPDRFRARNSSQTRSKGSLPALEVESVIWTATGMRHPVANLPQGLKHLETGQDGHMQIQKDAATGGSIEVFQKLPAGCISAGGYAGGPQERDCGFPDIVVIVHNVDNSVPRMRHTLAVETDDLLQPTSPGAGAQDARLVITMRTVN